MLPFRLGVAVPNVCSSIVPTWVIAMCVLPLRLGRVRPGEMEECSPRVRSGRTHIAMTLDSEYLRGSMAAVRSVLRHASCPECVFFHFVSAEFDPMSPQVLTQLVRSTFPSFNFKVYIFREDTVINLISSSIRQALENPLNYARRHSQFLR
ncbi:hypothetical protein SO802_009752 [Lithocarpus litseifolius]|uniref:Hexosyltransferase n=1 Tax=Lithocarpus litseifolius TaxID=425828 RepID=A0AAW2DCB6_9ROSI